MQQSTESELPSAVLFQAKVDLAALYACCQCIRRQPGDVACREIALQKIVEVHSYKLALRTRSANGTVWDKHVLSQDLGRLLNVRFEVSGYQNRLSATGPDQAVRKWPPFLWGG